MKRTGCELQLKNIGQLIFRRLMFREIQRLISLPGAPCPSRVRARDLCCRVKRERTRLVCIAVWRVDCTLINGSRAVHQLVHLQVRAHADSFKDTESCRVQCVRLAWDACCRPAHVELARGHQFFLLPDVAIV